MALLFLLVGGEGGSVLAWQSEDIDWRGTVICVELALRCKEGVLCAGISPLRLHSAQDFIVAIRMVWIM